VILYPKQITAETKKFLVYYLGWQSECLSANNNQALTYDAVSCCLRFIRLSLKKTSSDSYGLKLGTRIFIQDIQPGSLADKGRDLTSGDTVLMVRGVNGIVLYQERNQNFAKGGAWNWKILWDPFHKVVSVT